MNAEQRAFQQHWLTAFARQGTPAWPLPCGCVGFRCHCCGGDSATLGRDDLCHYGSALDRRHRWTVGEYAPGDEGGER